MTDEEPTVAQGLEDVAKAILRAFEYPADVSIGAPLKDLAESVRYLGDRVGDGLEEMARAIRNHQ